ncbi:MAG: ComF family protein [Pseudomonadota bacterium]
MREAYCKWPEHLLPFCPASGVAASAAGGKLYGMRVQRLVDNIANALLPATCGVCGATTGDGRICLPCFAALPWNRHACPTCAEPLQRYVSSALPCGRCQGQRSSVTRTLAPLGYAFPIDEMLKALKFHRRLDVAPLLAELAAPSVWDSGVQFDALVPVPLHRWRHARRGYNQAEELARALSRIVSVPVQRLVKRVRATPPQSGLNAAARRRNLRGAFLARRNVVADHVLIVDDVVTTGETTRAMARALQASGVSAVSALAVARSGSAALSKPRGR